MKLRDFFKKGYYINLDRRTDRRLQFEEEIKRYGLLDFFERFPGHDSINEPDFIKKHFYCAKTHIDLLKKIYEEGHDTFLIFEDDAHFYNEPGQLSSMELIENALDELQNFPDWDMFYLGGHPINEVKIVSDTLYRAPTILAAHAIGYKRQTIKKIIDEYKPFVDSAIDGWLGDRHNIVKYLINPIAVIQREGTSDLDAQGKSVDISTFKSSYDRVKKIC